MIDPNHIDRARSLLLGDATDEEAVEYALAYEFECKCCGKRKCHGCIIEALKKEIKDLRWENARLIESIGNMS